MTQDENINEVDKLIELSGSNYEIADGEPNIKGWDVKTAQHESIGKVDDMLFDQSSKSVKYIIVDVDNNIEQNNKKVLIPLALAELYNSDKNTDNYSDLDKDMDVQQDSIETFDGDKIAPSHNNTDNDNVVIIPFNIQLINKLPAYKTGNVTDQMESEIDSIFNGNGSATIANSYSDNISKEVNNFSDDVNDTTQKLNVIEENLSVEKQTIATGRTRLTSRIIENPVEKTIELKDEHVTVVRTPIDRPVSSTDADIFKEEQVEMTEYSEVPVVRKEAHVVEEIVVTKDIREKDEIIKETLRNTEVTAEEIKKPKDEKEY